MIIPFFAGIRAFRLAPVTWMLLILSGLVFVGSSMYEYSSKSQLNSILDDDYFLKNNGYTYSQFIKMYPKEYSEDLQYLAQRVLNGSEERRRFMGGLALGDRFYLNHFAEMPVTHDRVAHSVVKERLDRLELEHFIHPSFVLGLSAIDLDWSKWISYQFSHSGFFHFAGNMFFLLVIGSALEPMVGGLTLLLIYLFGGAVAAGVFLMGSGLTFLPLVGASGSISALMAFYCALHWRQPVRYLYFLLIPRREYAGMVYLPAWIALVMWAASDLAGYWSTLDLLGGVAYTAHLGGEAFGLIVGAGLLLYRSFAPSTQKNEAPVCPVVVNNPAKNKPAA